MIWVIDASVAVRWFVEEEAHLHADKVLEKIVQEPYSKGWLLKIKPLSYEQDVKILNL